MLYIKEIINHQIGDNTPFANIAKKMGFKIKRKEEECEIAYDGTLWEKGFAPQQSAAEYNEEMRNLRAAEYAKHIDPLHAVKMRHMALNTWTDEMALEYDRKIREITTQIQQNYPYCAE